MRSALAALPGVEKDSIQISVGDKWARFQVKDAAGFNVNEAAQAVDQAGFKATVAKTGAAFKAQ